MSCCFLFYEIVSMRQNFIGNIIHGQNFIKFYYEILSGTIFHYEIFSAAIKFCPFNGQYFM